MTNNDRLQKFRQEAYQLLTRAKDATFELMDAVMTTPSANSLAEMSLNPLFRRKWPSVYEALEDSRPQRNKLMKLYLAQTQMRIAEDEYLVTAIDHTAWSRPAAKTLQERTYEHQASASSKVTIGQGYSTIAWIPEDQGSWALPLRHERINSWSSPIQTAAWQLAQVAKHSSRRVLALLDREYGNAKWVKACAAIPAECIVRLRKNACLWTCAPAYSGRGKPRKHGQKIQLNDPASIPTADIILELEDSQLGSVRVRQWQNLHFYSAPGESVDLIQVERLAPTPSGKMLPPLWLVWVGERTIPLAQVWNKYLRRFGVDHWYRFAKGRLHWTLPNLSTPKQSERWSDLMPLMTWQLWLARDVVVEQRLPWQSVSITTLTPGRVAQSMFSLLVRIGTPARLPKTRGKSPGWTIGNKRTKKTRYPVVRKRYSRPQSTRSRSG